MRTRTISMCVMAMLAVSFAGCTTPEQRVRLAADTYSSTMRTLTACRAAGFIDNDTAAEIDVWRAVAKAAIQAWGRAVEAGTPSKAYEAAALAALQKLSELQPHGEVIQ